MRAPMLGRRGRASMPGSWGLLLRRPLLLTYMLRRKFRKFMESHYKQFFVSVSIFCLTNLFAEVQARMHNASLVRGKKRKADEP